MTATYVPAVSLTVGWINASAIAGAGRPLPGGAHTVEPRSPGVGAWALVQVLNTSTDLSDANLSIASITITIHAGQVGAAELAAVAVANLLRSVEDGPPVVLDGAVLQEVSAITGPSQIPVPGIDQYLVDADLVFQPTT